jgi:SAM-dependent methyltransferase
MELSPALYHRIVRPGWFTKKYIHDHIQGSFDFRNKMVLDFGAGTGANCSIFEPSRYIGMDPDAGRIRFAKRLYPQHHFEVLQGDSLALNNTSVDFILIIAVLHHIASELLPAYVREFKRILKPGGAVIIIEPYLCNRSPICNRFMQWYDKGHFIRNEEDYFEIFENYAFQCRILKRFRKCLLYNELFFSAVPSKNVH